MEDDIKYYKPRIYQLQLEEIAVRKNTIIHLPTGSGKTFIAGRLIKRFIPDLKKPWGAGGKRTFFLVCTVPLVQQQKTVIEGMCPVKVGAYSGEDKVDFWKKPKWDSELAQYEVIVMTAQILSDMLTHNYIRIEDINLVIFDECHQAVDDHPMRSVMKHFEECPVNKQPRVIGLTATLLNGNVKLTKVDEILRDLETTFHATIATVNENIGEVLRYSTNPQEKLLSYPVYEPTAAVTEAKALLTELRLLIGQIKLPQTQAYTGVELSYGQVDITQKSRKIEKEVGNMVSSMILHLDEMGAYGGKLCVIAYTILLERLKRRAETSEEEDLYTVVISHCTEVILVLDMAMLTDTGYEKIVKHSSPKIRLLLNILKEYKPQNNIQNVKDNPLSAIIFTQQRFTSKILYNLIKEVIKENPKDFGFLKHDFIVGFNVNPYNNTREQHLTKKLSHQALLRFKNGELNCIISTRVIEEGVDVPQCLLVVRYDLPLDYRSYVQSKGRARNKESQYILMVDSSEQMKFLQKYRGFQQLEGRLNELLMGNSLERAAPTEEDIVQNLYEKDDIPPYIHTNGKRLLSSSAISLLHRYCSILPHDQFTLITPMWIAEGIVRQITIVMPIACPYKDPIKGDVCDNLKSAKRSAALKACVKLVEIGELDNDTMLPRRYGSIDFDVEDIKACFPNWPSQDNDKEKQLPLAGTKKRVRKHKKMYPKCLLGEAIRGTQKLYLHLIKFNPVFPKPKESREGALYELLEMNGGYGFLTFKPMYEICSFPMFLTIGEVNTTIETNVQIIEIKEAHFELVKRFHHFIFDQVLGIGKKFLVHEGRVNCMYVVPTRDGRVDWHLMSAHTHVPPVTVPGNAERKSLRVTREKYLHSVVTPWYRVSLIPDRYIVSNVLEYLTPNSRFDSDAFGSYAEYYLNQYQLDIQGPQDQPLLEVRNITSRMNCLMPRAATINTFTEKQKKLVSLAQGDDRPKGFNETFVPEFCIIYDFPGEMWYKAYMLPSIVHRVTMLLTAYELRAEIAVATSYGRPDLKPGQKWLPIQNNINVTKKSLLSQIEEPATINSVDRINDPLDENAPRPLRIVSMKESLYQLQKKKLNKEYDWEESAEPMDIERNITEVTVMDIECYDAFAMSVVGDVKQSPRAPAPSHSAAILAPPPRYCEQINLLTLKATGHGPELRDIVSALTTINSHDTFDLERVETLGDSFLKFACTLYLYHKFPRLDEGQLTNVKGRLIGNRNLYYAGEKINLGGRMKVEQFSPRKDFVIPGFLAPPEVVAFIENQRIRPSFLIGMEFSTTEALSGKLSDKSRKLIQARFLEAAKLVRAELEPEGEAQLEMQCYVGAQAVSDKSVADCVEALIGTYLLSGGIEAAVLVVEWMKIIPPQDNFMSYLNKKVDTVVSTGKVDKLDINRLLNHSREDIERIIDYRFNDPAFLLEALSHPSYIRNRYTRSYERLEFLGDAILDFLITSHIFENCGNLKPGELTDLRSALVNNVTFASYVVKLGLHKYLCSDLNAALDSAILNFAEHQEQRDHDITEDVLFLIDEDECQVAEYIEVPKVLSDIFESIAGAIYLDSGSLETVWRVVYRIMWREIDAFAKCVPKQPVRVLLEMIHACPVFGEPKSTNTEIPKVMIPVTFTKEGLRHTIYGVGSNKSQARRAAAKLALKILAI